MKISKKISLAAILCALAVVFLLLGSIVETVTLSASAIAAICISVAITELGYGYSFIIYAAVTFLAFLLLPIKDSVLYFACFFGYYPILKAQTERLKPWVAYVVKGLVLTAAYALTAFIGIKFLIPEANVFKYVLILYPAVLLVFYAYDYALTKLMRYYANSLRKRLGIDKFFS